jgi:hypothetical protein
MGGMFCPKCGRIMLSLGNVSGVVYTTAPPQWDEVFVCHPCRIKKTVRQPGYPMSIPSLLDSYREVEE